MHGYISDLCWVMPQCTYLLYTIFSPYLESHNWVNAKNLASCVFRNAVKWEFRKTQMLKIFYALCFLVAQSTYIPCLVFPWISEQGLDKLNH